MSILISRQFSSKLDYDTEEIVLIIPNRVDIALISSQRFREPRLLWFLHEIFLKNNVLTTVR